MEDENYSPLGQKTILYKRRWYCFCMYCLSTFILSAGLIIYNVTPVSTHDYYEGANIDMADLNFGLSIGSFCLNCIILCLS
jgi:hypothetical protein